MSSSGLLGAGALGVALTLGVLLAPALGLLGLLGATGLAVAVVLTRAHPDRCLATCAPLILLAGTKFRLRDPEASMSGLIDGQIIIELGLYGVVTAVILTTLLSAQPRKPTWGKSITPLAALVTLAVASSLWSLSPALTIVRGAQLGIVLALAIVTVRFMGPERAVSSLLASCVAYVLICASLAMLVSAATVACPTCVWPASESSSTARFSWFAVHPITAANLAGVGVLFLLGLSITRCTRMRIDWRSVALWTGIATLLVVLIATRSRGALVAVLGAGLVLLANRYIRGWQAGIALSAAASLVLIALMMFPSPVEMVSEDWVQKSSVFQFLAREQTPEQLFAFSGREELWTYVTDLIVDKPLLGHGYMASRPLLLERLTWAGHAHNALLQSLVDLGLLGTALLWLPLGMTLIRSRSGQPAEPATGQRHRAIIYGVVVFLLLASFGDGTFAQGPGFLALVIFTCALATDHFGSQSSSTSQELSGRSGG